MPIVLADPLLPRKITHSGATLHFRQPPGDVVQRILRGVNTRYGADSEAAKDAAVPAVAARYVTDWEGVVQPDGSPVEWPEAGRFGVGADGPSAEALARRDALVRALPLGVLMLIEETFSTPRAEAADSGKGSPSV